MAEKKTKTVYKMSIAELAKMRPETIMALIHTTPTTKKDVETFIDKIAHLMILFLKTARTQTKLRQHRSRMIQLIHCVVAKYQFDRTIKPKIYSHIRKHGGLNIG